jgi:hypothetical protein
VLDNNHPAGRRAAVIDAAVDNVPAASNNDSFLDDDTVSSGKLSRCGSGWNDGAKAR